MDFNLFFRVFVVVLYDGFVFSSCVACVYVVLVRRFGFHRFVALFCVWVIRTAKHIRSSRGRDIKLNHGCQYIVELES